MQGEAAALLLGKARPRVVQRKMRFVVACVTVLLGTITSTATAIQGECSLARDAILLRYP